MTVKTDKTDKRKNGKSKDLGMVRPRVPEATYWRLRQAALAAHIRPERFLEELIERYLPPQFRKAAK